MKFKLKRTDIIRINDPKIIPTKVPEYITYNKESFSLDLFKKAIKDYLEQPKIRGNKVITDKHGKKIFDKALLNEFINFNKNEYRKKFSFRSKIFKQTYKFGQ